MRSTYGVVTAYTICTSMYRASATVNISIVLVSQHVLLRYRLFFVLVCVTYRVLLLVRCPTYGLWTERATPPAVRRLPPARTSSGPTLIILYVYYICMYRFTSVTGTVQRHRSREGPAGRTRTSRRTHRTRTGAEQHHTPAQTPTPAKTAARTHPGRTRDKTVGTTQPESNPGARQTAGRTTNNQHHVPLK